MNDAKIQISFIRDDPGMVIRGDTAEEVDELIRTALPIYQKFRNAVDKGKENRAKQNAPPGGIPKCETCGTQMIYKEGFNPQKNKKWRGYFCPNSKQGEAGHPPMWI